MKRHGWVWWLVFIGVIVAAQFIDPYPPLYTGAWWFRCSVVGWVASDVADIAEALLD